MTHDEDRDKLIAFLTWTHGFVLAHAAAPPAGVPEALRPQLEAAREELAGAYDLEDECEKIRTAPSERLRAAGLTGAQLELKLAIVEFFRNELQLGESVFGKLVDAIDTLLDSLIGAAGLASALKELKDAVRTLAG